MNSSTIRGLYGIADADFQSDLSMREKVQVFLDARASVVQIRMKKASARALFMATEEAVRQVSGKCLVLVNDRPDVALAAKADGVHVGAEDLPVKEARRVLGPHLLLGATVRSLDEAREAVEQGADYLGFGPVFATSTKAISVNARGLSALAEVVAAVPVPVVAIGGVTLERIPGLVQAGAAAVAVISEVLGASDRLARAECLVREFERGLRQKASGALAAAK